VNGGPSGKGSVFAVNTDGTGFTNLHSFPALDPASSTNSEGSNPQGSLILSGDTLYGTASSGGNSGNGTVFRINTNGMGFTNLHSFDGDNDGTRPFAGLIQSGNTLYGTAFSGGHSRNGTVFKLAPACPILASQYTESNFLISFLAFPGASYTVQQNTKLSGTNWINFTNFFGDNTVTQFTLPTTNAEQLFFRVLQP
jgi:uncharacterized repeat protein (TIGR03803 family)